MRKATTSILILAALATCGCRQMGMLAKREAEKSCPTDIRKTVPWCAGEDALFKCPCEPNATFYGYKPTCWGVWPTSGAEWRDMHCGNLHYDAVLSDLKNRNPELIQLPSLESLPHFPEEPEVAGEGSDGQEQSITVDRPTKLPEGRLEDLPNPSLKPANSPDKDSNDVE